MHLLIDLQACQTTGSRTRGIGRYSLSLARAMAEHGAGAHQVSLLLSDRFPETVASLRSTFAPLIGDANIHVMAVPGGCREVDTANAARLRLAERLRRHAIGQIRPDCVHVASLFEGLIDDAVCSVEPLINDRTLTAVTLYDLIPYLHAKVYLADANARRWYYRRLQWLRNADLLLAISESSRQEVLDHMGVSPDRVVNISSAIDPHFRPVQISADQAHEVLGRYGIKPDFVLYTGGVDYRKNIEGLIRAYGLLPPVTRQVNQLVVVCSIRADEQQRLQQLGRQSGLANGDLVFAGYVPEADLVSLYNLARLFVFPSLHEGFGLPVLEAMACGTPAIGSDRSSIPEVRGLKDALFDPTQPQAIASAITRALSDDVFRHQLRTHGLQQSRCFSWAESARRAFEALQQQAARHACPATVGPLATGQRRLRMAYLSPFPPTRSGIADYSANLLPELARHYDIELITDQAELEAPWLKFNYPVRSIEWFGANADRYDRVLYHFGNSEFHVHMLALLRQIPGVVMLHDYYLGGMLQFAQIFNLDPEAFHAGLFKSHGYAALLQLQQQGPDAARLAYPANRPVIDAALGVLVHSRYAIDRALQDYGAAYADKLTQVPFAQAHKPATGVDGRRAARERLGLAPDAFVVCSFGFLGATKLNLELLQAWLAASLATDPQAQLVFVGQHPGGQYGQSIDALCQRAANVRITGFASPTEYEAWLAAADAGVQLRTQSRGETSAAVFDCLTHALPLVYNAHGTAAELPPSLGLRLPDDFDTPSLAQALLRLRQQPQLCVQLGQQGRDHVLAHHQARFAATCYSQAIERFYQHGSCAAEHALYDDLKRLAGPQADAGLHDADLLQAAASVVLNRRAARPPCLLVDITGLPQAHLAAWLPIWLKQLRATWWLECVMATDLGWHTARQTVCEVLGLTIKLPDEDVLAQHQDVWLGFQTGQQTPATSPMLYAQRSARLPAAPNFWSEDRVVALLDWVVHGGSRPHFCKPWSCHAKPLA